MDRALYVGPSDHDEDVLVRTTVLTTTLTTRGGVDTRGAVLHWKVMLS
jgi:hypothetical protein